MQEPEKGSKGRDRQFRRSSTLSSALLRLDDILRETRRLLLGLGELIEQPAFVFSHGLVPRLDQGGDRGVGLAVTAPLDQDLLPLADQILQFGQVEELGPQLRRCPDRTIGQPCCA
jgi:hypothetical protein